MARVATAQQLGAVPGRSVWVVRVDPQVLDPWFLAGAISGADSRRVAGQVTSTLSGTPRADVRRLQIPVLPIESQRLYGNAYRRIAEFETLVLQAALHPRAAARCFAAAVGPSCAQSPVRVRIQLIRP